MPSCLGPRPSGTPCGASDTAWVLMTLCIRPSFGLHVRPRSYSVAAATHRAQWHMRRAVMCAAAMHPPQRLH
eukprot:2205025-Pyramimonas_sp.AAC.1